ncbi:uncharacterized protein LOC117646182 [Thrips palmi]|uniref:Uncharacterized protein LOC117646182 n=1 Tax=Thrips palmi TaxID=161013 RepID=A0A6P8YZW1_THRPL|nr:uncharacterized protein LOC117646182 [Thrips palmi]
MASWNELDLKPPPNLTSKVTPSQVSFSDLRKLSDTCWNALTLLKNQETLCSEAATLSRLIHRVRSMFRGDKGYKSIQKVHQCLRNFLAINLVSVYENFFRTVPWDCSDKEIFCPTRQMLEYVLIRTQGFAALLSRIVHTCLEAASFLKGRMNLGHHWPVALLCLSAVSRIWSLTKHLLNSCIDWYAVMLPYLNKFQSKGPLWLSESYVFPLDLTKWLSLPWMGTIESHNESYENLDAQSYGNFNASINPEPAVFSGHIHSKIASIHDDVGVSLSRASFPISSSSVTSEKILKNEIPPKSSKKLKLKSHDDVGVSISSSSNPFSSSSALTSQKKIGNKITAISHNKKIPESHFDARVSMSRESNSILTSAITSQGEIKDKSVGKSPKTLKQKKMVKDVQSEMDNNPPKKLKKKASKGENKMSAISSIKSQNDVDALLLSETRKRSLTRSLGEQQWLLLKNLVSKLNLKLKKVQTEKKKQQLLEQIKRAFQIALS